MSTAQKTLIDAIRRIALDSEALASALGALQKRGVIDGIKTTLGGYNELQDDCCTEGDGNPDDPGGEGDPDEGTIDGERPDDGNNEKGMDGTYRMPDGSFVDWDDQSCAPDDTWEQGFYWSARYSDWIIYGAGALDLYNKVPEYPGQDEALEKNGYEVSTDSNGQVYIRIKYMDPQTGREFVVYGYRSTCSSAAPPEASHYCDMTEPPCIEEDWPSDGKCQEALINGRFVPHPKDPDCAGRLPQDYQIMCNADKCIAYIPTKDGGHMRVEVDPITRLPVAGSDVKTYGSDGQFKGSNEYRYDNVKYNAYGEYSVPTNWE